MALLIKKSQDLIDPENYRLKVLVSGLNGVGKTTFESTFPKLLVGACECGHGKGLASIAATPFDYVELNSYADLDSFMSGAQAGPYESRALDSLTDASSTLIKDKAISIPRQKGDTQKRSMGVPELDDYQVMGELTRKLVRKFIDLPKHVICTTGLRFEKPDENSVQGEPLVGPNLPGQMFLGSTAMFDLVLQLRHRSVLADPKEAKSRYMQRYFITENQGGVLAKNRLSVGGGKSFLPTEVIFDPSKNLGTFDYFFNSAIEAYKKFLAVKNSAAA